MKLCVGLLFAVLAYASASAIPTRPNYLTEEDFARARVRPAPNGTIFNPPHHPVDFHNTSETRNAWRWTKWPGGVIPYTLDPNFDNYQRSEVAAAIDNYHRSTCVRFVPRNGEADFVEIQRDDGVCGLAMVCKAGGAQFARFGGGCISAGVMTHELGHTLCFGHEQTRPDRDNWISWNTNICEPHGLDSGNDWTTLDLLYDYVSIEHYEGECYNGCIVPRIPGVTKCGSGGTLSVLDIEKINAYYECGGCYSYRFRPISQLSLGENMVAAGTGGRGETLYPCRAYHNGDIVPGKGDPVARSCWVGWGGAEHEKRDNFEILTNPRGVNIQWVRKPSDGSFPGNAIAGGRSAEREPFYIGRCTAQFPDGAVATIPGKIHRSASDGLYIVYGGVEYVCSDYDILVCQ